jgi:hypothetical protein
MSIINSQPLIGASGQGGAYNLTNSLRFRSSASAYLNRTPASTTNQRTFTWSGWVKRGALGGSNAQYIFSARSANNDSGWFSFYFNLTDTLNVGGWSVDYRATTQVFRDPSAWYHLVLSVDTTQATASNRVKVYVNGSEVTAFSTTNNPTQNFDYPVNSSSAAHSHGSVIGYSSTFNFDGYLTEVNFIDGQALTPSSFGETSATTGVWIPKKYTGTYGTNGFYLPFTDNSALTTSSNAGLGKDFSGNSNYWTTNNISITSGSTYDSMTDVPTLTSATAANYCVLNPLDSTLTLINANLSWNAPSNTELGSRGTIGVSSGKWYYEYKITSTTANPFSLIGWASQSQNNNSVMPTGVGSSTWAYYPYDFKTYNSGTASSVYGVTGSANDIIMVALDLDNSRIYWGRNGTWFNSGNPATQTNPAYTNVSGTLFPWIQEYNQTSSANFGQQPFTYTPPTGFVRLNTFNLPTPTIGATAATTANKYFNATTYTGTGSSLAVTNSGSMQPDFVWLKNRSSATYHWLTNAITGTSKQLTSNATDAESSYTQILTAFNSNGFTVGTDGDVNANGSSYVGWQWRASNATAVTNTAGTITSTVSANTTAGFSIVTYTGNGTNASTVGHGLGVAPSMYIVKRRSNTGNWYVYHISIGNTNRLRLDETSASTAESAAWNNTSPTSTVFSIGTSVDVNASANTYVAYCFAQVAGYSAFGSYTGNDSADGTFIYTGFRPAFVLYKKANGIDGWAIYDAKRNTYNVADALLQPNTSGAEAVSAPGSIDILSNGFKQRNSNNFGNSSSFTYIYMAFAENPFKYANAR